MTKKDDILRRLDGLHTIETIQQELKMKRQSVLNLVSKLKNECHLTYFLKGKKPVYRITMRKQWPRKTGMFDMINKHSPHMKIAEWHDHQVHGKYDEEDALIDAIKTKDFRVILATLHLFKYITSWPKLYKLAKKNNCWQELGALYDTARLFMRVRKMPRRYRNIRIRKHKYLISDYKTKEKMFLPIAEKWKTEVPFRIGDIKSSITPIH